MRTLVTSVVAVLVTILAVGSPVNAQSSHAAPQSALDAALQQHVATEAADRDVILQLLDRTEVQALAGEVGLDLRRANDAVATLDGVELSNLASQARQAEEGLSGGQSRITISTTLIIIALLVVILLIVAID
jgi:hypothetical protein